MLIGSFLILVILMGYWVCRWLARCQRGTFGWCKLKSKDSSTSFPRHPPKPEWVRKEIIRLKAFMPHEGCRTIAHTFNRLYAVKRQMAVGKTYVSYTLRKHQYEIQVLRRTLKHRRPRPVPKHLIWGMDLTGKTDSRGQQHPILGILEHQSRACLSLSALTDKSTISLIRVLLDLIEKYQKPKIIRTDNEAVVTSRLFRVVLWLLNIKHQRTELACPWQNGRIERFFGTLKQKLNQWEVESLSALNGSLLIFRCWYNHIRPHQYLAGMTPAEVWRGDAHQTRKHHVSYWYHEWEGLLTGYYLPP